MIYLCDKCKVIKSTNKAGFIIINNEETQNSAFDQHYCRNCKVKVKMKNYTIVKKTNQIDILDEYNNKIATIYLTRANLDEANNLISKITNPNNLNKDIILSAVSDFAEYVNCTVSFKQWLSALAQDHNLNENFEYVEWKKNL